jgi:hypothetical protein
MPRETSIRAKVLAFSIANHPVKLEYLKISSAITLNIYLRNKYLLFLRFMSTKSVNHMWITLFIKTLALETMPARAKCLIFVHLRRDQNNKWLGTL